MDKEKRKALNDRARLILGKAGLDPDCIWKAQLSIDEIVMQPGLSDRDAEAVVEELGKNPSGSLYALGKGLSSGIMHDWDIVAIAAGQELAAEAR